MQQPLGADALFNQGRLDDAIAAATARVRQAPTDAAARITLAELLLFTGNLQRADTQLDTAAATDPAAAIIVAALRQLIRAEQARVQLFTDGRVPEFLDGPNAAQQASLAAIVALRQGDAVAAATHAAAAEAVRPVTAFTLDDQPIDDLRDADDIIGGTLEVLTTSGKYLWVPIARVLDLAFQPATRPRDLFWRQATLTVQDGPSGDVIIPALYPFEPTASPALRLGRETDWQESAEGLVRGLGQRVFLAGADGVAIQGVARLVRVA